MNLKHNGFTVIGTCSMDNIEAFNKLSYDLKQLHGRKNVWFDRDNINRVIIFLTH